MRLLESLERVLGRFAVRNLPVAMVVAWSFAFVLEILEPTMMGTMALDPAKVLEGEVWRVFTVVLIPPIHPGGLLSYLFFFFVMYLYFMMGNALESQWGSFRFNVYILLAWFLIIGTSFLAMTVGDASPPIPAETADGTGAKGTPIATNGWLLVAIFLAFAWLYPNFTLLLFLILPVRIKWLAWLNWGIIALILIAGPPADKIMALTPVVTFLMFFGGDVLRRLRTSQRRVVAHSSALREEATAFHTCMVCGVSDKDDPDRFFRVTSDAEGHARDICMPCLEARKRELEAAAD